MRFVDAATGDAIASIPPQLTTHSTLATCFDALACRLYVLLSNGHVHVWHVQRGAAPQLDAIWTHLERRRMTCLALLTAGAMPQERARALGLEVTDSASDLLLAGTADGDVLLLSLAEGGVLLQVCAHKLTRLSHVLASAAHSRLLTVAAGVAKVWNLEKGFHVIGVTELGSAVTSVAMLCGSFVLATGSGHTRFVDATTGRERLQGGGAAHGAAVQSVSSSAYLQHAVTASADGALKLWRADRHMSRSILIARPATCACFLNQDGDIVCGIGSKVMLVQRRLYSKAYVNHETEDMRCGALTAHIKDAAFDAHCHSCAWEYSTTALQHWKLQHFKTVQLPMQRRGRRRVLRLARHRRSATGGAACPAELARRCRDPSPDGLVAAG